MREEGYFAQTRHSPLSLGVVIALHVAGVAALMLAKMEMPPAIEFIHTLAKPIKAPPIPPQNPPEPRPAEPKGPSQIDSVIKIPLQAPQDPVITPVPQPLPLPVPGEGLGTGPIAQPMPQPLPLPEPVKRAPKLLTIDRLQPPYPASEQRQEREGVVVLSVLVGADGRVKSVEQVEATSAAFFQAAERHALRHWRFAPATEDGRAVESRITIRLRFQLER